MTNRNGKLGFNITLLMISLLSLLYVLRERKVISPVNTTYYYTIRKTGDGSVASTPREKEKDVQRTPFFIGAGPGTTGTTTLFTTLCSLGFPSVHFRKSCTRASLTEPIHKSLQRGLEAHYKCTNLIKTMNECCSRSRQRKGTFTSCPNFDKMASNLLKEAKKVVESGLMAAIDTPYPSILQYMQNVAEEKGRLGILILTERDPKSWLISRASNHPESADVICDHVEHAFDLQACLRTETSQQKKLMMRYSERNMTMEDEQQLYIDSMRTHQRNVKNMYPVIQINVWNEAVKDDSDLRQALLMRMKHLVSPSATLAYHSNATALIPEVRMGTISSKPT